MSNVDLFNLFSAQIFALLYEQFPLPKQLSPENLAEEANYSEISNEHARQVAGHTLNWLSKTGYIEKIGEITPFRYILSPKGFEILNASPFSGRESKAATLGEQLVTSTKEAVSSAGKEELKSLVKSVIGWGVGSGFAGIRNQLGW